MDQFTYAERATDWRGNNNIAESIFEQMSREDHPVPAWIVMSAGTGGTSATLRPLHPLQAAGHPALRRRSRAFGVLRGLLPPATWRRPAARGSRIEGIGRPRVEPSFVPEVIDRMMRVPDEVSLAAMRVLSRRLGRRVGGSTGTNFFALCVLASRMKAGRQGLAGDADLRRR